MALICAAPESKPTIVILPLARPSSLTASTIPIAEPRSCRTGLQIRVSSDHRLGDVGRLQVVAVTVLDVDDLDVGGVVALHLVDEAVTALHTRRVDLGVADDRDLALLPDQLGHVLGGEGTRLLAVRRGEAQTRIAVAGGGVEVDHGGDLLLLGLLQRGGDTRLGGRARRSRSPPGSCRSRSAASATAGRYRSRRGGSVEGDVDAELLALLVGALLHGLPELVLEALGDERDRHLAAAAAGRRAAAGGSAARAPGDRDRRGGQDGRESGLLAEFHENSVVCGHSGEGFADRSAVRPGPSGPAERVTVRPDRRIRSAAGCAASRRTPR